MSHEPKFRIGQVVCIRPCSFQRISHVRMSPAGWAYSPDMYKRRWFPEERLRKLTKKECGLVAPSEVANGGSDQRSTSRTGLPQRPTEPAPGAKEE